MGKIKHCDFVVFCDLVHIQSVIDLFATLLGHH